MSYIAFISHSLHSRFIKIASEKSAHVTLGCGHVVSCSSVGPVSYNFYMTWLNFLQCQRLEVAKREAKKAQELSNYLWRPAAGGKKYTVNSNTLGESDSTNTSNRQEEIIEINMASEEQDQKSQCKMAECLKAKMDKILSPIDQIEENIKSKFSVLLTRVSDLESKVEKLMKDVDRTKLLANDAQYETKNLKDTLSVSQRLIKAGIKALENNVDDLQGRLRSKTLVFRGIPEGTEDGTSWNI